MTTQPAGHIPQWTLADRLRKAREDAGLEQTQLAETMSIARTTVSNYEHANTSPRPYILKEWALVTGVPLWWLKGESGPSERSEPIDSLQENDDSLAEVIDLDAFRQRRREHEPNGEPLKIAG